jgi:hypothetical protein
VSGGATDDEIEALVVDRYLEALLARQPADATDVPLHLRTTARRLAAELPRAHPSFRFEEHLARRLVAAGMRTDPSDLHGAIVPFPAGPGPAGGAMRPVVIGGVLTSAALSLAGAAFVAWRRSHPSPETAMARVVRSVVRARIA